MKYLENQYKTKLKRDLYRHYQIDRKTLNKWVRHFCGQVVSPAEFNRCRKISDDLFQKIMETLGKSGEPMRKRQILDEATSDYQTVRGCIQRSPERFGVCLEVYDRLSVFPPAVCKNIIEALG